MKWWRAKLLSLTAAGRPHALGVDQSAIGRRGNMWKTGALIKRLRPMSPSCDGIATMGRSTNRIFVLGNAILLDLSIKSALADAEHFRRTPAIPLRLFQRRFNHRALDVGHLRAEHNGHHVWRGRLIARLDRRRAHACKASACGKTPAVAPAERGWLHVADPTVAPARVGAIEPLVVESPA